MTDWLLSSITLASLETRASVVAQCFPRQVRPATNMATGQVGSRQILENVTAQAVFVLIQG